MAPPPHTRKAARQIRKPDAGRKPYWETHLEVDQQFLKVLRDHAAGDPMDDQVRWTDLQEQDIVVALARDYGTRMSRRVVRYWLKRHHYQRRKAQKRRAFQAEIPQCNAQFEHIAQPRTLYEAADNPILSMDTKKKEYLGNFYREGHLYTLVELQVYDHDFPSCVDGVIIPHSLYDIQHNLGYIQIGTSYDTSEFACDSLRHWWYTYGQQLYPEATSILGLCYRGSSNNTHHYLFKRNLQALADEIGVEISITYYPPYCAKCNPLEHRLFPHINRACQGGIFTSLEVVVDLLAKTHTATGLKVFMHVLDKLYATGHKVTTDFKECMRIVFDETLPRRNYRAIPAQLANGQVV